MTKISDDKKGRILLGYCCFNHIIGLPQRNAIDKPLYDYEKIVFDSLVTQNGNANSSCNKHLSQLRNNLSGGFVKAWSWYNSVTDSNSHIYSSTLSC